MKEKIKEILDNIYADLKQASSNDLSLMSGKAGIALYLYLYEKHFKPESEELQNIIQQTAENPIDDFTLAAGKAGTDWLLQYLYKEELLENNDINFFCTKENDYENAALQMFEQGNYDLLYGSIGITYYLLYVNKSSENFYKKIFCLLNDLLKKSAQQNAVPFYDVPSQKIIPGKINLGLAHGISSILKFCVQCFKQNICKEEAKAFAEKIIEYLYSHANTDNTKSYFSNFIGDDTIENIQSRLAWCYGDLSIAYILLRAAKTFSDKKLENFSLEILSQTLSRKTQDQTFAADACFCHGSAGVAYLYNRIWNTTKNKVFKTASDYWINETFLYKKTKDNSSNFKESNSQKNLYENEFGLLEGNAGIGLALLSCLTNDTGWDYCLMLND